MEVKLNQTLFKMLKDMLPHKLNEITSIQIQHVAQQQQELIKNHNQAASDAISAHKKNLSQENSRKNSIEPKPVVKPRRSLMKGLSENLENSNKDKSKNLSESSRELTVQPRLVNRNFREISELMFFITASNINKQNK